MNSAPPGYGRYVFGSREPVLDEVLRHSLLTQRLPTIQIDDDAGRILQLLTVLRRPRHVIEIGTLFGYSTIYLARGLPEGGRLTTVEIDSNAAEVARRNLKAAAVDDRVNIVVCDAKEYLATVPIESVGMIFIDADKKSYPYYLKLCFPLLESGGLLIADDAFAAGDYGVEGNGQADREVNAIRSYVRAVGRSRRLLSALVGTETGMLVSFKE